MSRGTRHVLCVERLVRDARSGVVRGGVPLPHEWNGMVRSFPCVLVQGIVLLVRHHAPGELPPSLQLSVQYNALVAGHQTSRRRVVVYRRCLSRRRPRRVVPRGPGRERREPSRAERSFSRSHFPTPTSDTASQRGKPGRGPWISASS